MIEPIERQINTMVKDAGYTFTWGRKERVYKKKIVLNVISTMCRPVSETLKIVNDAINRQ